MILKKRRAHMRIRLLAVTTALAAALIASAPAQAQSITGVVSSAEEGNMEGVLVSAKKEVSTMTITVVSDAQGRFSFPAAKIGPGKYNIAVRAIGWDLQGPGTIEVAADKPAAMDVKLAKTRNLSRQMSNG